jgi:hypothetical protein
MKQMKMHWVLMLAAIIVAAVPFRAAAQASALAASEAAAFLGTWELGLDTPQGAATVQVTLKDEGGKVAGTVSMEPLVPGAVPVTDISKDGSSLVLKYSLDVQGMSIPAKVALVPDGANYKASFDFMEGQFVVDGTAKKK